MRNKKTMNKVRNTLLLATVMSLMFIHDAYCTEMMNQLKEGSTSIKGLIAGPVGQLALVSGSLYGGYREMVTGNAYRALGIVLVGILMGWHIDSILKMFG